MPPRQAFIIACVIVLAVLGLLSLVWRSTLADTTASYLRRGMSALSASMFAGIGTFFLLAGEPNILIGVGVGIAAYASALKRGFISDYASQGRASSQATLNTVLRFSTGGNIVAGCSCGIGCLMYGGAVGVLGASLSACWTLLQLWVLTRMAREG